MRVSRTSQQARLSARLRGEKTFVSGKGCKYGHTDVRLVSTGRCKMCAILENRERSLKRSRKNLPEPTRPCPEACELCGKIPNDGQRLHLDHDHVSGQFRGWLCAECNSSLGHFGDSLFGIEQAAAYLRKTRPLLLPVDAAQRKTYPIATGVLDYFPAAICEISNVSYVGNIQHNGAGTPLFWARGKSIDQTDTFLRHFFERGSIDVDGVRHSAKMCWRALAILQLELVAAGAPIARGAVLPEEKSK